jgi:integral membrane sensor domain MASE1
MATSNVAPLVHPSTHLVTPAELDRKKWMIALVSAVIAVLVFSPFAFKLVNSLTSSLGFEVSSAKGRPTMIGLLVHGLVYLLIVRALMYEEPKYEHDL